MREMPRQKEPAGSFPERRRRARASPRTGADESPLIAGVSVKGVKHVPKENGFLVEIFRDAWKLDAGAFAKAFQVTLFGGAISAGTPTSTRPTALRQRRLMKVLHLRRPRGFTHPLGAINEFRVGRPRPVLILVPPKVWHGVQNIGKEDASIVNLPDHAYRYEDPDHWRLPPDTDEIPYSFARA